MRAQGPWLRASRTRHPGSGVLMLPAVDAGPWRLDSVSALVEQAGAVDHADAMRVAERLRRLGAGAGLHPDQANPAVGALRQHPLGHLRRGDELDDLRR